MFEVIQEGGSSEPGSWVQETVLAGDGSPDC